MPTLSDRGPQGPLSNLYVHIPYCRDRCTYCAFATVLDRPDEHDALLSALLAELRRHELPSPLDTLYIGGGTPGLFSPSRLARLVDGVSEQVALTDKAEITLEVNPLNVSADSLTAWHDLGITRLSVGVQTFESEALRQLARHHDGDDARRALKLLAERWTHSWSADLLVGWQNQTPRQVRDDTRQLLHFHPPHVSVYGLTIEPGTPLQALQAKGRTVTADPELAPHFDTLWSELLSAAGLERYEVSNFAQPGHDSRHNASYWRNDAYLGLGPGASSSVGQLRWSNTPQVPRYLEALAGGQTTRQRVERLDPMARLIECLAVGLRTQQGVSVPRLDQRFTPAWRDEIIEALQSLEQDSFLEVSKSYIKITPENLVLADNITSSLIRMLKASP